MNVNISIIILNLLNILVFLLCVTIKYIGTEIDFVDHLLHTVIEKLGNYFSLLVVNYVPARF